MHSDVERHSAPSAPAVKREDMQTAVKSMGEGWNGRDEWHNGGVGSSDHTMRVVSQHGRGALFRW